MRCSLNLVLAVLLAVASLSQQPVAAIKELSPWVQGIITHYGGAQDHMDPNSPSFGTLDGACGYGSIPKDKYPYFTVAALSPSNQFYKAGPLNACGQCFQIQCVDDRPGVCYQDPSSGGTKSVVVMISDVCPECEADHIDVQSLSFAKLANPAVGRIKTQYRRVECTPSDDMKVAVLDYRGGGGWVRLSIDDTGGRGAVKAVSVKNSNSQSWQPLTSSWGAQWESASAPPPPLDFKITCDDGEDVVATGVIKQSGINAPLATPIKFATGVQFTITDPSFKGSSVQTAPKVASFSGPADSAPVPEGSPSNGSGGPGPCVDTPPPGSFSCQQQKDWGKCSDPVYLQNNYCAATCGRCGGSPPAAESPAPAPAPSSSGACTDTPPPGSFSCQQQKDWGKCSDPFYVQNNYCAATCGRCSGNSSPPASSSSNDNSSPSPAQGCTDTTAPDGFPCVQQKGWGKCTEPDFVRNNYCAATCGRCSPAGSSSPAPLPSPSAAGSCTDVPAPGSYTCQQQKDWGKCTEPDFVQNNYCAATCGRCGSQSGSSAPKVASFEGPSAGRKLLLRS